MTTVKHPAKYSDALIPVFAEVLKGCDNILDPMAGVGGVHRLREWGYETTGVEIEPEWAAQHNGTVVGNALDLPFLSDTFDAVVVSPTYGNRMADHHDAKDSSIRRTYKHDLGRDLHCLNSGQMQWGFDYRLFHATAWAQARKVLKDGGRFVLNVKDHIRKGQRQYVSGWHVSTLCRLGFDLQYHVSVATPGMKFGENADLRVPAEEVYVFTLNKGILS